MFYLRTPWGVFYGVYLEACKVTEKSLGCRAKALNREYRVDLTGVAEDGQAVPKYKCEQQSASIETHFLLNTNILDF